MTETSDRALSLLGIAAESLLKYYLTLKVLFWIGYRAPVPLSSLFEWVLVILLSELSEVNTTDPAGSRAEFSSPPLHDGPRNATPTEATSVVAASLAHWQSNSRTLEVEDKLMRGERRYRSYASNIPRRTPRFLSSTRAPTEPRCNETERPSLIPLPFLTALHSSLPPSRSRPPASQKITLSGAQSNVPRPEMNLEEETRGGENMQVPVGGGVYSHHASQLRASADSDDLTKAHDHEFGRGGIKVGVTSRRGFSFIKHMNQSPSHHPPISGHPPTGPVESLLSTPRSTQKASPSRSGAFVLSPLQSPFSKVAASVIALGRDTRGFAASEGHERFSCCEVGGRALRCATLSCDGHQNLIRNPHSFTPSPRAPNLASAVFLDDGNLSLDAPCPPTSLTDNIINRTVTTSSAIAPPLINMGQPGLAGGAPDPDSSLDFPTTASVIFPSLLCEPFDSSDSSLAKHFNDIDLASPAAQRLLRSSVASLESIDTLVRYVLEGNVDPLHSPPVEGNGPAFSRRKACKGRARPPAPVSSAGLLAQLESTPTSANPLYRGSRRPTIPSATPRLRNSGPLRPREEPSGGWPKGSRIGDGKSREGLFDGMAPDLPNFVSSDNLGSKTSLLMTFPLPIQNMKTPSPPQKPTHLHLRSTDNSKRPSWR